ncbi:MAG TPA: DUF6542 domain-containing protein [Mycobacteriales bacterium]|nr:DUF6542 domain-containing protein [Mycobacteriales bacterium]
MSWTTPANDQAHPPVEHHLHLPDAAHVVADRRGLTAAGAVAIALVLGVVGAAVDVKTGHGLRTVFAVCFVGGSALAAVLVHREDLRAAVVIPPFTYCALAVIGGFLGSTKVAGSFVTKEGVALLDALILRAPVLFVATGAALVIALVRKVREPRRP